MTHGQTGPSTITLQMVVRSVTVLDMQAEQLFWKLYLLLPKCLICYLRGEITPYELELKIQNEGKLPNLRNNGLKLLMEGKTDIAAIGKMIDMSTDE